MIYLHNRRAKDSNKAVLNNPTHRIEGSEETRADCRLVSNPNWVQISEIALEKWDSVENKN